MKKKKILLLLLGAVALLGLVAVLAFRLFFYPAIKTYEPVSISYEADTVLSTEMISVRGITPFGRSFDFYYQHDSKCFSNGYAMYKEVELLIDTNCLRSVHGVTLRIGERTCHFDSSQLMSDWPVIGHEGQRVVLAIPGSAGDISFIGSLMSIWFWWFDGNILVSVSGIDTFWVLLIGLLILAFMIFIPTARSKEKGAGGLIIKTGIWTFFIIGLLLLMRVGSYGPDTYTGKICLYLGLALELASILLVLFYKQAKDRPRIVLPWLAVGVAYIVLELVLKLLLMAGWIGFPQVHITNAYDKDFVRPDLVSGYKLQGDSVRTVELINGELIYDNIFHPNEQGYNCRFDYVKQKEKNSFRVLVFGDSFTAADFLATPWPERAMQLMGTTGDSLRFEFYSFALNGAGLLNWYSQFFREAVVQYEFDAVVFAVFGDDLSRDYISATSDSKSCYYHKSPRIPRTRQEFDEHLGQKILFGQITDKQGVDRLAKGNDATSSYNGLYLIDYARGVFRGFRYHAKHEELIKKMAYDVQEGKAFTEEEFIAKYSKERLQMLDSMIRFCTYHHKPVIIAGLPHKELIEGNKERQTKNALQAELEFLSKRHHIAYFDSYPCFQALSEDSLMQCFFTKDVHWNQNGSDRFISNFAPFMKKVFLQALADSSSREKPVERTP